MDEAVIDLYDVLLAAREGLTRRALYDEGYAVADLVWASHPGSKWTLRRAACFEHVLAMVWVDEDRDLWGDVVALRPRWQWL
jgi:hypothetical protein